MLTHNDILILSLVMGLPLHFVLGVMWHCHIAPRIEAWGDLVRASRHRWGERDLRLLLGAAVAFVLWEATWLLLGLYTMGTKVLWRSRQGDNGGEDSKHASPPTV